MKKPMPMKKTMPKAMPKAMPPKDMPPKKMVMNKMDAMMSEMQKMKKMMGGM